jgi:hypothetical protein
VSGALANEVKSNDSSEDEHPAAIETTTLKVEKNYDNNEFFHNNKRKNSQESFSDSTTPVRQANLKGTKMSSNKKARHK